MMAPGPAPKLMRQLLREWLSTRRQIDQGQPGVLRTRLIDRRARDVCPQHHASAAPRWAIVHGAMAPDSECPKINRIERP